MSLEVVFYTQVGTVVAFVVGLFVLYRVLVSAKDATIELLRDQKADLERRLEEAHQRSPDALAQSLSRRVERLTGELERLNDDREANEAVIQEKESELRRAQANLAKLRGEMAEFQELAEEYFCPHCKARLESREYPMITGLVNGREVDADFEVITFECGLVTVDGREDTPCGAALRTDEAESEEHPP